jgi:hypothetical protein
MIKREERDIKRELQEEKKEEREIQRDEQEGGREQAELELVRMKAGKLQREVLKMDNVMNFPNRLRSHSDLLPCACTWTYAHH